jgi:hypothetical protein
LQRQWQVVDIASLGLRGPGEQSEKSQRHGEDSDQRRTSTERVMISAVAHFLSPKEK